MKIRNIILTIAASIILIGCGSVGLNDTFKPKTSVRFITTTTYPEFPNIQPVSPVNLIPWIHEAPRNTEKVVVKNISTCIKVAEEDRDRAFWNRCGENPILLNSNIFVGFDQQNWNIILENFAKLRETLYQYKQRIIAINKQREDWRRQAEEERQRIQTLETLPITPAD